MAISVHEINGNKSNRYRIKDQLHGKSENGNEEIISNCNLTKQHILDTIEKLSEIKKDMDDVIFSFSHIKLLENLNSTQRNT